MVFCAETEEDLQNIIFNVNKIVLDKTWNATKIKKYEINEVQQNKSYTAQYKNR